MAASRTGNLVEPLTDRQREVLQLIAEGRSNPEIATRLGVTIDGAKWHVREILSKLGVESREEAADWWRRERAAGTRLRRIPGWTLATASAGRIAATAVFGVATTVAVVAAVFLVFRSGDETPAEPVDPGATATVAPSASTSVAPVASVTATPDDVARCIIPAAPDARAEQMGRDATVWMGDWDGRAGSNCVGWSPVPGNTEYNIESWHGEVEGGLFEGYRFETGGTGHFFPPHGIGTLDPAKEGCFYDIGDYRLVVIRISASDGTWLGGVEWTGCDYTSLSPAGCPLPDLGEAAVIGHLRWRAFYRACVTWRDAGAAASYRIELRFPKSGEQFSYVAPASSREVAFPSQDAGGIGEAQAGIGREEYAWSVVAVAADGSERVVGTGSGAGKRP